jgi:MFS transporter, FSR family, fosmidomycin resistance protein
MSAPEHPLDRRGIGVLAAGHLCSDMTQGAVAALLPFLISQRGLSYAAAGALLMAATVGSSFVQPFLGAFADRLSVPFLLPAGVMVGGAGVAVAGITESLGLLFLFVVLGGLGVGAFHPEGARFANYVSGDRRATGMSIFAVGGNAGFALGPVLVTPLVLAFGLPGTLFLALPTTLVALALLIELPRLRGFVPDLKPKTAESKREQRAEERWGPFARLSAAAVARTGAFFGLMAFLPVYLIERFGASEGTANAALTVMLVSGAVGTLIGGRLGDRYGRRAMLAGSMAPLAIFCLILPTATLPVAFLLAVGLGATVHGGFSSAVVLGQEYLPQRVGLASGITFGLSIGLGGVVASGLGVVADATSLTTALWLLAGLPALAFVLALGLPETRVRSASTAASAAG